MNSISNGIMQIVESELDEEGNEKVLPWCEEPLVLPPVLRGFADGENHRVEAKPETNTYLGNFACRPSNRPIVTKI